MQYYIYRFLSGEGEILYVGRTNDLKRRISSHFSNGGHLPEECYSGTDKIEYLTLPAELDMMVKELYYISKWVPKYNTLGKYSCENSDLFTYETTDNWFEYRSSNKEKNEQKKTENKGVVFKLKELLQQRGMNVLRFSEMSGINKNTIYGYLNNDVLRIDLDIIDRMCNCLGCGIPDLMENVKGDKTDV